MSTAATTQHRFSDPIAMAAAVVVIIGGATVIGVAATQDSTTAPATHTTPAQVNSHPGAKVGLGDFAQDNGTSNRGDYAAPPQGGAPSENTGDNFTPPPGGHPMVGLT
jgi:hypothetical protein